ncbi:hypothetical protein SM124_06180 [Bacillus sp. 31A1R]|uniref:Lipoprotein n=1 Tax=Robertmurraya mangrovi TaxID=3098077 RepID=A0ABU5IW45_9BACI|nr:hypothetical protein [Bacillus sp. 31A1R]MDZ5471331.1 hypothetical protein [Bacillus sp. 31A1R]
MKKVLFGLFTCLVILTGCFGNPVQDDLLNYINEEIQPLADLETKAMDAYDSVTGANYTDDQTTYNTIKDEVVPTYRDFIDKLEAIKPETEEVSKLHEQYIDAANMQHSAFIIILDALEKADTGLITEANDKLAEARKGIRSYQKDLEKLAEENNVEFEEE